MFTCIHISNTVCLYIKLRWATEKQRVNQSLLSRDWIWT